MAQDEKMIVINKKNTLFITTEGIEKKKDSSKVDLGVLIVAIFIFSIIFLLEGTGPAGVYFFIGILSILAIVGYFSNRKTANQEKRKLSAFIEKYSPEGGLEKILKKEMKEHLFGLTDSKVENILILEDKSEYLQAQTLREELAKDVYEALDRGLIVHREAKGIFSKLSGSREGFPAEVHLNNTE